MILAFVAVVIVILLTINFMKQRPKNYPPGPPCLPLIGNIPFVPRTHPHLIMAGSWREKYGPVVGLVLGPFKAIAVCGPEEVLEVLRREEFQGRPKTEFLKDRSFNKYLGLIFSDGPFWMEQRRFTLRHLKEFGFGKKSMGNIISEEVEETIKEMSDKQTFQVNGIFAIPTLNVLWSMIGGIKYSREDPEIEKCFAALKRVIRRLNPAGGISDIFPFLKRVIPGLVGHTENMKVVHDMQTLFRRYITEHEKTRDENNSRDLIDVYLKEMELQKSNPSTTFTEEGLIINCLDLFVAGGDTTASSLEFFLLYMVLYPRVQNAVHKELDFVVGQNRRPTLEDRSRLPYVDAVIAEIFRMNSSAPLAAPHRATEDTHINGYFIPKDTFLLISLYSLHKDKGHWGDPDVFRPERFLNQEGKFVKDEWLIPFSAGKRMCLGEVLARSTVFLFFTSLLQEFTFSVPDGDSKPSIIPLPGITIAPHPFSVKVTKRV